MEGKLIPGVHYVQLKDDLSDTEEQMEYYLSHPIEMKEIIANANRYVDQFRDPALERQISLLVIQKYFEHTRDGREVAHVGNPAMSMTPQIGEPRK